MSKSRSTPPPRKIRALLALCGWALFAIEWVRVASNTVHSDEIVLLIVLILALLMIHASIYAWVGHNKRIAARGTRGVITRYASPEFALDHLGRTLIIDQGVRQSQEIVVSIEGDSKAYHAAKAEIAVSMAEASKAYDAADFLR